jgi:hypothetical protein
MLNVCKTKSCYTQHVLDIMLIIQHSHHALDMLLSSIMVTMHALDMLLIIQYGHHALNMLLTIQHGHHALDTCCLSSSIVTML